MDSEASLHIFAGSTKRLMRSAWLEACWHFLATFVEGNGNEWIRMIRGISIGVFGKQLAIHQRMDNPKLMDDSVDDFRGMVCSLSQVQRNLVSMRLTQESSAQDEEVYARPVGPGTFAPPQQRFVVKEAIYRPLEFSKILLGPKNCCPLKVCSCKLMCAN